MRLFLDASVLLAASGSARGASREVFRLAPWNGWTPSVAKDRPVLFSALAWADALLTLDREDFAALLGSAFYGLPVLTPGTFLERERATGQLKTPKRGLG